MDCRSRPDASWTGLFRRPERAGRIGTPGGGLEGPGSGILRLLGVVGRERLI